MAAVAELANNVGTSAACQALSMPRASYYRDVRKTSSPTVSASRPSPARALRPAERDAVLARLHEERFQDRSPAAVYATLLDEGEYHCSIRTMYRLLDEHGEVRERRDQLTHPPYQKPELLATAPNQLWSWDITKLLGPAKWTYFYLYVLLDVFSRYVTGWMVAYRESAELAKRLIEESCKKQHIQPGQLTLHADRGTSMSSKPVAFLLADLGVTKTHSRPHISNDNPYSESQFRTLKIGRSSRTASGAFRIAELSVRDFFAGTTRSIAIPAWACLRRRWCTMATRKTFCGNARKCSMLPTNFIRSASYETLRSHPSFRAKSGSTSPFHEVRFKIRTGP